jgi:cysteine-rich repeat protein
MYVYYERMCYYLPGCSSLAVINNTLICLACTLPNFEFSIKIKKCTCQKGYNFSTVDDKCNGNCGDALKVPTEGCDDGNLINGDGCNDLCKVETNFKCEENNNSKSQCIFTQDINIIFDYI